MIMLISKIGTQSRMGLGRVTFCRKGPMRGFLDVLYRSFIFKLLFLETQPLVSLNDYAY